MIKTVTDLRRVLKIDHPKMLNMVVVVGYISSIT